VADRGGEFTAEIRQPREATPAAFMERALALSRIAVERGDGSGYGAVVVNDGRIVGEGWNRVDANNDPTAHGEVEAIRDAASRLRTRNLSGCVIYTTHGYPCPMCAAACHWAGLDRIFYSNEAGAIVDGGAPVYERC